MKEKNTLLLLIIFAAVVGVFIFMLKSKPASLPAAGNQSGPPVRPSAGMLTNSAENPPSSAGSQSWQGNYHGSFLARSKRRPPVSQFQNLGYPYIQVATPQHPASLKPESPAQISGGSSAGAQVVTPASKRQVPKLNFSPLTIGGGTSRESIRIVHMTSIPPGK